jgi:uncharacterized protein YjbI with pentapeptide repeats
LWHAGRARASTPDQTEGFSEDLEKAMIPKANELDAARKSVEDGAAVSVGIWLSYLFTLFYIGIAAGGISHADLLLENAVKLPFLSVELPLVAFFALAPVLFIISHTYSLMHFVLLAAKVRDFNVELEKEFSYAETEQAEDISRLAELRETRLGQRRRLPSNIFVQFLAGPRDIRDGGLGWLLKAVAWISLVIGPVLLLLVLQIQFLPYHLAWVTWLQRLAVLADVTLLWFLWPAVLASRSAIRWPRPWRFPILALLSLVPMCFAFAVATFPGEWLDESVGKKQWIPLNLAGLGVRISDDQPRRASLSELLFFGEVNPVTRRRTSPFSNTLVLPSFHAPEGTALRGRHLEGAVLDNADLRGADLTGAQLQRASLRFAQLQGQFPEAATQGAPIGLTGANLMEAQLQGAYLMNAELREANLNFANLMGAFLWGAQLQGASLFWANLNGADLWGANLQAARLQGAHLAGADLTDSVLWQTDFQDATLTLADLRGALFQATKLGFRGDNILVDDNQIFVSLGQNANLTKDEATYDKLLAPFLVDDLATRDSRVLRGIAMRDGFSGQNPVLHERGKMMSRSSAGKERTLYRELSCGLLRKMREGNVQLETRIQYLVRIISPDCPRYCSARALKC